MNKRICKYITIFTAAVLMLGVPFQAFSAAPEAGNESYGDNPAAVESKSEVVYGTLSADGAVESLYVVNHFELSSAGKITDYGDYDSVVNLTNTAGLTLDGGTVTGGADEGDFYYQGNVASAELPWLFDIAYLLDGARLSAEELAGRSGNLEIKIRSEQNTAGNPVFYDNYMLQISVTLDTESCRNIDASGATVAEAGSAKTVSYTVLPGGAADFSLTADVRDFTMTGIDIVAIPYSMSIEMPNMDSLTEPFQQLADAISELHDGVGELADGAGEFADGASGLKDGSSELANGLTALSDNAGSLATASAEIRGALRDVANSISQSLGSGSDLDMSQLTRLPAALKQLADGIDDMLDGLALLKEPYSQTLSGLSAAIGAMPEPQYTQQELAALYMSVLPEQQAMLNELMTYHAIGTGLRAQYSQMSAVFYGVESLLDGYKTGFVLYRDGLNQMAAEITSGLSGMDVSSLMSGMQQLAAGLSEMAAGYGDFHKGLQEYLDGVSKLSDGYGEFHDGLSQFSDGADELADGINELYDGTGQLRDETADMPDMVTEESEKLLEDYLGGEFEPVSFMSEKNESTALVQFVLKCAGVEKPAEEIPAAEPQTQTLWDRLVALFKR